MPDWSSAEARLRLLDSVFSCSSFELIADCLLEPMVAALQASSAVFLEFVERPGVGLGVGKRSYLGRRPWSVDAYAERFFRDDPLMEERRRAFFVAGEVDDAIGINALPVTRGVHESEYYRRFLRPSDIGQVMGFAVPFRSALGAQMLCLGFHRRPDDAPFGAAEFGLLRQLGPMVRSALCGLAAHETLPVCEALVEHITRAHRGSGHLILDDDLIVLHAAGTAADDLALASPGAASSASLLGELRQQLLARLPGPGEAPLRFRLSRPTGTETIAIEVHAVATGSGRRLIVSTSTTRTCAAGDSCGRYGLTARESEIARMVCTGSGNVEIARLLGISIRTVENHLRSIFDKAGVHSRTQLAARLLR